MVSMIYTIFLTPDISIDSVSDLSTAPDTHQVQGFRATKFLPSPCPLCADPENLRYHIMFKCMFADLVVLNHPFADS